MSRPFASVLIPTREPGPLVTSVLESVFAQKADFSYEVLIVDSGSGLADLARMKRFPVQIEVIPPAAFGHGRTRNLLAQRARGEVLLFLSQDAEPASPHWMQALVAPLAECTVAGAYARQIPRPDADILIRFFLSETYRSQPLTRRLQPGGGLTIDDMFFSNVSSALRKDVWERLPFRESVLMSEDQYWAHDALRAGYELAYEPAAEVYHSHNYSLAALFRRNRLSGRSLRGLIADSPAAVIRRGARYVATESVYLLRRRQIHLMPYMLVYEFVKSVGFALGTVEGGRRAGRKHPPGGVVQRLLS
jgi:rhamnosyltransferase